MSFYFVDFLYGFYIEIKIEYVEGLMDNIICLLQLVNLILIVELIFIDSENKICNLIIFVVNEEVILLDVKCINLIYFVY